MIRPREAPKPMPLAALGTRGRDLVGPSPGTGTRKSACNTGLIMRDLGLCGPSQHSLRTFSARSWAPGTRAPATGAPSYPVWRTPPLRSGYRALFINSV